MVKRGSVCFHPSRPKIDRGQMAKGPYFILFRNGGGIHTDSLENKATYPPNAPGFKRHRSGTNCGKPQSGETARVVNCLILTKNMV